MKTSADYVRNVVIGRHHVYVNPDVKQENTGTLIVACEKKCDVTPESRPFCECIGNVCKIIIFGAFYPEKISSWNWYSMSSWMVLFSDNDHLPQFFTCLIQDILMMKNTRALQSYTSRSDHDRIEILHIHTIAVPMEKKTMYLVKGCNF